MFFTCIIAFQIGKHKGIGWRFLHIFAPGRHTGGKGLMHLEEKHADILILGAGCAGLTAGIYAARAGKRTIILEKGIPGGQAALTSRIENYPGLPQIDGVTLMQTMAAQAEHFGAQIVTCTVESVDPAARTVETDCGRFSANALIVATGAQPRRLGIPGEEEFTGRGVSYCAACDGALFRGREIFVVGGGNSAAEEALYLAELGSRVRMLVRKDSLRCDTAVREQVMHHPKIEVLFHRELAEIRGTSRIETLVLRDSQTGETETLHSPGCGVFIFIGYEPASALFNGKLELCPRGGIVTDENLRTKIPGVYAAGDVRRKNLRQIVTAVSDGAIAAMETVKGL